MKRTKDDEKNNQDPCTFAELSWICTWTRGTGGWIGWPNICNAGDGDKVVMTGDEPWPLERKKNCWPRGNKPMGKTDHTKKDKKRACVPVRATTLDMLASNITRGMYAPYVGDADIICGVPCNPCDATVGISESLLDSMYKEAIRIYDEMGMAFEDSGADSTRNQLLKDVRDHMAKYTPK